MNNRTHKIGGVCAGLIASTMMFSNNLGLEGIVSATLIVSSSVIGSTAPDIDHPESKVGRKPLLKPISKIISKCFGHRTITHSLVTAVLLFICLLSSTLLFTGVLNYVYSNIVVGFCIGWISHLILDLLTVKGIPLFYPFVKKKYRILKFKTNRDEEFVSILTIFFTGILIIMHFKV